MKDIQLAVKWSKRFESLLRRKFDASGRGLHELVSSCENQLDQDVVRKLRFIATLRNKLIHEEGYDRMDDRNAFLAAAKFCQSRLEPASAWKKWGVVFLLLVLAGIATWAFFHFRGTP